MEINRGDKDTLERLEEELWREETRFDLHRMNELLAEDFIEFGRSGRVYQRQDTLSVERRAIDTILPLPNLRIQLLDANIAQVTYDSADTHNGVIEYARRCSILSRTKSCWELHFHQGTPFIP